MDATKKQVMQIALAANKMSTSGNYQQMVARLMAAGVKGKPGPKPKSVLREIPEVCATTLDDTSSDPLKDAFFESERPRVALLISDKQKQDDELERRFKAIQDASPPTVPKTDVVEWKLKEPLDTVQATELNMTLDRLEKDEHQQLLFVYKPNSSDGGSSSGSSQSTTEGKGAARSPPVNTKKRKADDDDAWESFVAVVASRVHKKLHKGDMSNLLSERFDVQNLSGKDKATLSMALAEQLCYETDDDDDE